MSWWRGLIPLSVVAIASCAAPDSTSDVSQSVVTSNGWGHRLTVVNDHFEFNGQPRFLVFVSYFDGVRRFRTGDRDDPDIGTVSTDFDYLKKLGVDGIRILPMWYADPGPTRRDPLVKSYETVCDGHGVVRPPRESDGQRPLDDLVQLVYAATGYFVVDVSFSGESIPTDKETNDPTKDHVMTVMEYGDCIREVTKELAPFRHVLFDIQNESNKPGNGPGGIRLTNRDVHDLRAIINEADRYRIVVTSMTEGEPQTEGNPIANANARVTAGPLDANAYHDPRVNDWYTPLRLEPIIAGLRTGGKPVYLQEPQKLQNQASLTAANFRQAVETAKGSGAAAWCFHTEAGFWMRRAKFKPEQVEADFLDTFRVPLDTTTWGTTFSPYYQVRLFTKNQRFFLSAVGDGGGSVHTGDDVSRSTASSFLLHDVNGGELMSGDHVTLQTYDRVHYLHAEAGGGGLLTAVGTQEGTYETFVIDKLTGDPPQELNLAYPYRRGPAIKHADWVVLRTESGFYISPDINTMTANVRVDSREIGERQHIEFLFEATDPFVQQLFAPASGARYLIPVDAPAERAWTATSNAAWLAIVSATSGVGPASVTVQASENASPTARVGQITVADQTITVSQAGAGCSFQIAPTSASVARAGGTGSVNVTGSAAGCGWTATTDAAWLSITAGSTGTGSGTVSYAVAANPTTSPRTGSLRIAERVFTVTQLGNARPTVAITMPANGAIYEQSVPITIAATAADSDGVVVRVDFFADGVRIGSSTTAPYGVAWTNAGVGWHTITAEAFDDLSGAGASAPVSVGVNNLGTVAVSPASPRSGQLASITVTGVNPCGAVDLDFGDGQHITFAITGLPITQSHAWATGGQKTITATAHGNCAGIRSTTITVVANTPPSVSLTAPASGSSFVAPATIALSATASDSDSGIARVEFYSGSTLIATDTTSPYSYTWSGVASGPYTLTARAIDNDGASTTSAAAAITVRDVATVSVSPATVVTGQPATVTVTGSSACGAVQIDYGDGTVITYPLTGLPISQSHVWTTGGTKTITATGQATCFGQVSTTITVNTNAPPMVALMDPPDGSAYVAGTTVSLAATASDPHGVARVEFYAGSTLIGSDTTAPYGIAWVIPSGSHGLTARAFDAFGATAVSGTVWVSARDVVSVSVSPAQITAGNQATITVTGSATCGAVAIDHGDGTAIVYAISGLPISRTHTWASGGWKTVTATGQGSCIGLASTLVNVNTPPAVTLTSPVSGNTYDGPASIALTANASDLDGAIASVRFYSNGSLLATDATAPYSWSWTNVPVGTYVVTAIATDNAGATASSAASITVRNPGPSRVTSMVVEPSVASVGQAVTVSVYGTNACGAVEVTFGDGQGPVMPILALPYLVSHAWPAAGTYTLTASGHGNCSGQVSTTLIVQ